MGTPWGTVLRHITPEEIKQGWYYIGCSHKHIHVMKAQVLQEHVVVSELCHETQLYAGRFLETTDEKPNEANRT